MGLQAIGTTLFTFPPEPPCFYYRLKKPKVISNSIETIFRSYLWMDE